MNSFDIRPALLLIIQCWLSVLCIHEKEYIHVKEHFNVDVSPCDDLYKYVCNLHSNQDDHFHESYRKNLFHDAYHAALKKTNDVIYDKIAEAVRRGAARNIDECYHRDAPEEFRDLENDGDGKGQQLGRMIASGITENAYIRCTRDDYCIFKMKDAQRGFYHTNSERTPISSAPPFIQGVIRGFLDIVDRRANPQHTRNNHSFSIIYPVIKGAKGIKIVLRRGLKDFKDLNFKENFQHDLHRVLFKNNRFSPYFNLLYSRQLIKVNVMVSEAVKKDIEAIYSQLKEEIVSMVNNSYSTQDGNAREAIIDHLNSLVNIFGMPDRLKDLAFLDGMIAEYRKALKDSTAKPEFTKKCCKLESLARLVVQIFNVLIFENGDRIRITNLGTGLSSWNYQKTLFDFNAFYTNSPPGMHVLPAFMHIFKKNMSVGMKHGIIGQTMGHELFHALGLTDIMGQNHMLSTSNNKYYMDAVDCYTDYYGAFGIEVDGEKEYPDGSRKADEGFADVEGARIGLRVLMKVLKDNENKRLAREVKEPDHSPIFKALPATKSLPLRDPYSMNLTEVQWFFVTRALMSCTTESDHELFEEYRDNEHPRPTIRVNAMVAQMREFTEAFNCQPKNRLYVSERRCELFPQIVDGRPAPRIGAWKDGAKIDWTSETNSAEGRATVLFIGFVVLLNSMYFM